MNTVEVTDEELKALLEIRTRKLLSELGTDAPDYVAVSSMVAALADCQKLLAS